MSGHTALQKLNKQITLKVNLSGEKMEDFLDLQNHHIPMIKKKKEKILSRKTTNKQTRNKKRKPKQKPTKQPCSPQKSTNTTNPINQWKKKQKKN